jgi:flagellar assembly protein FliH
MTILSKIISREHAENAQRWHIPDMSKAMPEQTAEFIADDTLSPNIETLAVHEKAQREGYKEGYEKGQQTGSEELSATKAQLESILEFLQYPVKELQNEVEHELVELSLAIAKQVLRREIKSDPQHIIGIIREAVKQLPSSNREIAVHLHPDDAHTVRETLHEHKTKHHWDIIDDPGILQGNCQINAGNSFIDASIDALIARLAVEMLGGQRQNDQAVL